MPKTGSTFIQLMLREEIIEVRRHSFDRYINGSARTQHIYSIYRPPVAWYTSFASFLVSGSERYVGGTFIITKSMDQCGVPITVDTVALVLLNQMPNVKNQLHLHIPVHEPTAYNFIRLWQMYDGDIYSFWCNHYLANTTVLSQQHLSSDFGKVALSHGLNELANKLLTAEPINVTTNKQRLSHDVEDTIRDMCKGAETLYAPRF